MSETAKRKKKAPFAGLPDQVERLACDGLTSTALARRLAVRIADLAETDPHFLSEAQTAAGVIAGLIEHDEPARAAWMLLGDEIERYWDRTAPGREAEQDAEGAKHYSPADLESDSFGSTFVPTRCTYHFCRRPGCGLFPGENYGNSGASAACECDCHRAPGESQDVEICGCTNEQLEAGATCGQSICPNRNVLRDEWGESRPAETDPR